MPRHIRKPETSREQPTLRETRVAHALELRASEHANPGTLVGYAALYDTDSEDMGFVERIAKGAFDETLQDAEVIALLNHDDSLILGRRSAKTLRLEADDQGLRVEIDLPDNTFGRDVAVSVARGDLKQMSFSFQSLEDEWDYSQEVKRRTLKKVSIDGGDVSVVAYPAYPDTTVALRSLAHALDSKPAPASRPYLPISRAKARLQLLD